VRHFIRERLSLIPPLCRGPTALDRGCLLEAIQFAAIPPGRSMIHADSTYFIAQALGYRADVAYWIAAYNENADYAVYAPIDQCGVQATATNSGASYITAKFNGFQRTNNKSDGPLYHYVLNFSPSGQGTDTHGASGVQAVYPFHYPPPGYPVTIDDVYQGTLYDLRQWAMQPGDGPSLLCSARRGGRFRTAPRTSAAHNAWRGFRSTAPCRCWRTTPSARR
jgi:hypothetical protein